MIKIPATFIHTRKFFGFGFVVLLLVSSLLLISKTTLSQESSSPAQEAHIAILRINGAIGPATTDYISRAMDEAIEKGAVTIIITIDTPGGLDAATRDLIKKILASNIPIVTYVHPAGGRAASAGTYILYASHIAAMTPSTTLGAATPVSIGLPSLPKMPKPETGDNTEDDSAGAPDDSQTSMERKILNDSIAFIRGLASRHGRNEVWAEQAVRDAATLTAAEALELNVIDYVANDIDDLLTKIHQHKVNMENGKQDVISENINIVHYEPDWRNKLLAIITDPQVAYILLMIGIYGLLLEGYNPGALVPGIIGGICLLTAFYALQVLPINYAGLALIFIGILFIVAETMAPSFGILGIGGIVATTLGSIMLIDSDLPGMQISRMLIGTIASISSMIVFLVLFFVARSLRIKRTPLEKAMIGQTATVSALTNDNIYVSISGEQWCAKSEAKLNPGDLVTIVSQDGLILDVQRSEENKND